MITKYYLNPSGSMVIFTTDKTLIKPNDVFLLEYFDTEKQLEDQIKLDWGLGTKFSTFTELQSAYIDFKIIDKSKTHNLISTGAFAMELKSMDFYARKIDFDGGNTGISAEESLNDAVALFMAEELKYLKDQAFHIDDLITTPIKAV